MPKINKILISGGGTGGHVFPAIAIADAFRKVLPNAQFLFVGAYDKLEMEKVPLAGYPIKGLWISGFHRHFTLKNIWFPFKLVTSLIQSFILLKKFKPDVAIGVGGFASGPVLAVSSWLGIPFFLQEQNAYPGVTNRLLKNKAEKIFVAYRQMESFFPKEKIVLSGNPIRAVFQNPLPTTKEARGFFEIEGFSKVVLVIGGSLGAASVNRAVQSGIVAEPLSNEVFWIWQVGAKNYQDLQKTEVFNRKNVLILPFIDRMDMAYAASDLVVGRAGALTIAELARVKKPCVLVPSPNVAADHQTANAKAMEAIGGGTWIPDKEVDSKLIPLVVKLVNEEETLIKMKEKLAENNQQDSSMMIVNYILRYCNKLDNGGV